MTHHSELAALLRRAADILDDIEAATPPPPVQGPELRRLFSYDAAATYLGCSRRLVQDLAATGEIAKIQIGSRVLLAREDLDAYVDRRRRLA